MESEAARRSDVSAPPHSVLVQILDRARETPDAPAVQDDERELTYSQLIDEVQRVAAALSERGVEEGDRVAVLIPNSVDFVSVALATLWAGALFVPLAVTDPQARLANIVRDCAPTLIVATGEHAEMAASIDFGLTVSIASLRNDARSPRAMVDAHLAYIIYTSGTTGSPKGVEISNAAFSHAVHHVIGPLNMNHETQTLCISPFHFDGSYGSLFPTLSAGGRVVIRPREALLFPRVFFTTLANEGITYVGCTPSYLRLLLSSTQMGELGSSALRALALGGEAISLNDLRSLWSHAPSLRVINRYGPTETTIAVTNHVLTPEVLDKGVVPIGQPNVGVTFVLIDDQERVVDEAHVAGELLIGGDQLMDGYWANSGLTSEVMRDDIVAGQKLYRTGDLAYRNDEGNYVYVDRLDRVVKRNGVRISLVELATSLNQIAEVSSAACIIYDNEASLGIAAFVTVTADVSSLDIRRAASQRIPQTMLPDRIEIVPALPLNRSNQLDEAVLRDSAGLTIFRHTAIG